MDIKLANTYIIAFLLILNSLLLGANFLIKDNYTLTKSEQNYILSYLNSKNIICDIEMPTDFSPIQQVNMKKTKFDEDVILNIFFSGNEPEKTIEFDTEIFTDGKKKLNILNNTLYFEDLTPINGFTYDEINAEILANVYQLKLSEEYGQLEKDFIIDEGSYFLITYTKDINRFKNFSDSLSVKIYKNGTITLSFSSYSDTDFSQEPKNIYSSYEVLYVFANEISNILGNEFANIEKIDLGYALKNYGENISFQFEPFYRIYLSNMNMPFFINAYTNTFEYNIDFTIY